MARLPSSRDVPGVALRQDPGLSLPNIPSTATIVAQELKPAVDLFQKTIQKQQNREDTIDRAGLINEKTRLNDELIQEINKKEDLSDRQVLFQFGQSLVQKRQEIIKQHRDRGASEDSLARLDIRLQDVDNATIGVASSLAATIGRDKLDTRFDQSLNPLILSVQQNPTPDNIEKQFANLETQISDLSVESDPTKENEFRRNGRQELVLNAIDTLNIQGRIELASNILNNGRFSGSLSPEKQRQISNSINTIKFNRGAGLRKIQEAEGILGRTLTTDERAQFAGLKPPKLIQAFNTETNQFQFATEDEILSDENLVPKEAGKEGNLSSKQQRIDELTARGLSLGLSQDIANKDIKIIGPDDFGDLFSVNITTGEKTKIEDQDKRAITTIIEPSQTNVSDNTKPTVSSDKSTIQDNNKQNGLPFATSISQFADVPFVSEDGSIQFPESDITPPDFTSKPLQRSIEKGTGPFAQIQAGISNFIGPFTEGAIFKDTTDARQQIKIFNQFAKSALSSRRARFTEGEQSRISTLLPDIDKIFTDPDTQRNNLKKLGDVLRKSKKTKIKESKKDNITTKRKAELSDQISRIDELISLMKSPKKINILNKEFFVGDIVTNKKGQRGLIKEDGLIEILDK